MHSNFYDFPKGLWHQELRHIISGALMMTLKIAHLSWHQDIMHYCLSMITGSYIRLILWKAAKAVETVDKASIAQTGHVLSDFTIMEALLHKGPMPINKIGEKVLLTSGSMTAAVNRMESKELVERIQDPSDGRRFYVHLTKKGAKR
jgi:DNA-binding MarR family transcriptional regulator